MERLAQAIAATFGRRKTEIPTERPDGLTSAFASDPKKEQQWAAFVAEVAVNPGSLADVIESLALVITWAVRTLVAKSASKSSPPIGALK
jgi:hypothetical protein